MILGGLEIIAGGYAASVTMGALLSGMYKLKKHIRNQEHASEPIEGTELAVLKYALSIMDPDAEPVSQAVAVRVGDWIVSLPAEDKQDVSRAAWRMLTKRVENWNNMNQRMTKRTKDVISRQELKSLLDTQDGKIEGWVDPEGSIEALKKQVGRGLISCDFSPKVEEKLSKLTHEGGHIEDIGTILVDGEELEALECILGKESDDPFDVLGRRCLQALGRRIALNGEQMEVWEAHYTWMVLNWEDIVGKDEVYRREIARALLK
ncbi:hypothetical protein BS50DRAFT_590443 [Corynespora cassiicola Philippines]|uniref:Uncharacterized protein n=1 Tax=Corynespora cassiicola Philippines TaxID=1448308 RepID=A0A2T2NGU9_CORCC|nr:hypothetical protein BS50DRAFT_590443 [Corynespora cassiicola Philippines]